MYSHVGTWTDGRLCDECGHSSSRLEEPLQIEWQYGSDQIADFSWCGYTAVITERVRKFMLRERFECDFGMVEVVPYKAKKKRHVPFPYVGPQLHWLIPRLSLPLDEKRSGLKVEIFCQTCERKYYRFQWRRLVVSKRDWNSAQLFCARQLEPSSAIFVPTSALAMLRAEGFTNIGTCTSGIIE